MMGNSPFTSPLRGEAIDLACAPRVSPWAIFASSLREELRISGLRIGFRAFFDGYSRSPVFHNRKPATIEL